MGSDAKKNYKAKGRIDALLVDPDEVVLVDDPTHELYSPSVHLPIKGEDLASVLALGVHQTIKVRRELYHGKMEVLVVAGRQRIKWACEVNKILRKSRKPPISVPAMQEKNADVMGVMISEN